ncbi:hypothetical protein V8D89_003308 [Ganoderma adspersum]
MDFQNPFSRRKTHWNTLSKCTQHQIKWFWAILAILQGRRERSFPNVMKSREIVDFRNCSEGHQTGTNSLLPRRSDWEAGFEFFWRGSDVIALGQQGEQPEPELKESADVQRDAEMANGVDTPGVDRCFAVASQYPTLSAAARARLQLRKPDAAGPGVVLATSRPSESLHHRTGRVQGTYDGYAGRPTPRGGEEDVQVNDHSAAAPAGRSRRAVDQRCTHTAATKTDCKCE